MLFITCLHTDYVAEIIGEEIYDEFDAEGESHLKSYASTSKAAKGRPPRGREGRHQNHVSPAVSEGTVAVTAADQSVQHSETARISQSVPASPRLSGQTDGPPSRTPSLGQSLTAFAFHRKNRVPNEDATALPPITMADRNRFRSQQRGANSDIDATPGAPSSGVANRIAGVQEEDGARIPDDHERSGPDIPAAENEDVRKE